MSPVCALPAPDQYDVAEYVAPCLYEPVKHSCISFKSMKSHRVDSLGERGSVSVDAQAECQPLPGDAARQQECRERQDSYSRAELLASAGR